MHRTPSFLVGLTFVFCGLACDSAPSDKGVAKAAAAPRSDAPEKAAAKAEPAAPAKAEPAPAEPAAPAEIVLEEADLPGLGKLAMPKGFKSTAEKHWSYDLGDYKSISVSWEPHGAPNLKKAETLSNILASAETVKSATTLDNGYHEIERVRENDGFTFIALFGKDWYVKCVAPAEKMDVCRQIVRSKP